MARYYIKISGGAFDVAGKTPAEAWDAIRAHCEVYCTPTILEIGKDVDEQGWPIDKKGETTLTKI